MEYETNKKLRYKLASLDNELQLDIAKFKLSNKKDQYGLKLDLLEMVEFLRCYESDVGKVELKKNTPHWTNIKKAFFNWCEWNILLERASTPRVQSFKNKKMTILQELAELKITATRAMDIIRCKNMEGVKKVLAMVSNKKAIKDYGAKL